MGYQQLFIILAALVVNNYCYNVNRNTDVYDEYHGLNPANYPTEFINKQLAALSSEELKELMIEEIDINFRIGDVNDTSLYCKNIPYNITPKALPAASHARTIYYIVYPEGAKNIFQIRPCDRGDGKCIRNETLTRNDINHGYKNCCYNKEGKVTFVVLSTPAEKFDKYGANPNLKTFVKKEMYLKHAKCVCSSSLMFDVDDDKCNNFSHIF